MPPVHELDQKKTMQLRAEAIDKRSGCVAIALLITSHQRLQIESKSMREEALSHYCRDRLSRAPRKREVLRDWLTTVPSRRGSDWPRGSGGCAERYSMMAAPLMGPGS